jgi:thiol-disulfide isomerase/thioredoxin
MKNLAWSLALAIALLSPGCGDDDGGMMMPDTGPPEIPCDYPEFSGDLHFGETLPTFGWRNAMRPDGSFFEFTAADFHCSSEYDGYTSMILMVSAGWCSACPAYIDMLNGMAADLEAQGVLVVYVEVETANFLPADSRDAAEYIDDCIAPDEFEGNLRIGDSENLGEDDELLRPKVTTFPSAYFVRRRDMRITADQGATTFVIDFGSLAADPEQEWMPVLPPFEAHCGPGDEEAGEPNDDFGQAGLIEPGVEITGGVCTEASDFYQVTLDGPWRFDLYQDLFTMPDPELYDVNLRLWGPDMSRIGGSNVRGNHDWVDWMGPAFVEVYGEQRASGTYRVSLSHR